MNNIHTKQKLAWRLRNKDKRKIQRKRHYDRTSIISVVKKNRPTGIEHRPWTAEECDAILNWDMCTDREIGRHFKRSVHAIQTKRYMLKKNERV